MAMANPLNELQRLGQSPWLDNIHRGLLRTGELARMVRDGEITGLTSNPTIFQQAIAQEGEYDEEIATHVAAGRRPDGIVDALVISDIQAAADVFLPVFTRTKRADGYVSIEVSPTLADDTTATVREARRLWRAVNRPNLLVKIPATPAGIPAIAEAIAGGINVNVTLIFSLTRYEQVMDAYLDGLTRRLEAGMRVDRIASVASFFVSRVDSAVDRLLEDRIAVAGGEQRAQLERLRGKAAIAQAKLAYAAFRGRVGGDRFNLLGREGARPQRPLWASTSTKNPAYPDVYYVEALIGPDTVNTMPPATLAAYQEHGHPENRLEVALDKARAVLAQLAQAGIDMNAVTQRLETEGVAAFTASYRALVDVVATRREAVRIGTRSETQLGPTERGVRAALTALAGDRFAERLQRRDTTLWPGAARDALAWLDLDGSMEPHAGALATFADECRTAGLTHALVCATGASALVPDLLRRTLGTARGALDVAVLDSTDPTAVLAAAGRSDPVRTLFVFSSSSADDVEVRAFLAFFWDRLRPVVGDDAGRHAIAITRSGTMLARLATERGFRRVFETPAGLGARWAALSHAGLVPAALMGHDVAKLLDRARRMHVACGPEVPAAHNPGIALGAMLGAFYKSGRDKLTLLQPDKLASLAEWIEQLVAGATGKNGRGIVPVTGEPVGPPATYGKDRVFVHLRLGAKGDRAMAALARAGHPVIATRLNDGYDVAGEIVRWEVAATVAAHQLGVNPADDASPAQTEVLAALARPAAPAAGPVLTPAAPDFATRLGSHLAAARGRRYVALTAYLAPTPRRERLLREMRVAIRKRFGVATTAAWGPRALHTTAALHTAGPATAIAVQLTCDDGADVSVPGETYSFGALKAAQAATNVAALQAQRRPVLRVHLGRSVDTALTAMLAALQRRPPRPAAKPKAARRKVVAGKARAGARR